MIFRLKTSEKAEKVFLEIKNKLGVTPNIASRLSIAFSMRQERVTKEEIENKVKIIDSNGLEFQRHTLLGENEVYYKVLMESYCNEHLMDSEFFPIHYKYHLENGLDELKAEADIAANLDSFIKNLINL